jgi:ABC-2 type transport system ATP-binding protein
MSDNAIEVRSLAKRFSGREVLRDVSFSVPKGSTFAFLGRNGAGKTTTILTLLGLFRPDGGEVRVLGLDPRRKDIEVRRRVGYVAENQAMFGWMRVAEILRFMAPFYPTWDHDLAAQLTKRFELPAKTRIHHLSKGENSRLALLLALAHRPELAILDDPTLGLDPIMRKEFLRDVVEHLQGSGVTVFFSSHLLYEIEPVADIVAILDGGRIVRQSPTEELRDGVKRVILPASAADKLAGLPGVLDVRQSLSQVAIVVEDAASAQAALTAVGITPQVQDLNLDEIFEAYVVGSNHERTDTRAALERVA